MARINLLPWRAELKRQRRKEYLILVGGFSVLTIMLWGIIHWSYTDRIAYQNERNAFLTAETVKLDKQIKEIHELEKEKQRLIARMKAIESLQSSRPLIVHILDELVTALPEGVYLTEVSQQGESFEIKGVAESNARVSSLMRNIEKSTWLRDPKLEIIQTSDDAGRKSANFILRMKQNTPKAESGDSVS